jgi:hypothetical protein
MSDNTPNIISGSRDPLDRVVSQTSNVTRLAPKISIRADALADEFR